MTEYGDFSIRVVDEDGDPKSGVTVSIFHHGFMGGTQKGYTDDDGWVSSERYHHAPTITEVYVDGDLVASDISPDEGETYSYTVS